MLFGSISCKLCLVAGEGARMWQIAEARDKGNSASCSGGSGHHALHADGIILIARVKRAGGSNDDKF